MADLEDFLRIEGWTFRSKKPSTTYPNGHTLIITRSRIRTTNGAADLTWIDGGKGFDQLLGVPYDATEGRLYGWTSGEKKFEVTVTMTPEGRIEGEVAGYGQPEAGTWGADANGGVGEGSVR
jgi:hypothetical protein